MGKEKTKAARIVGHPYGPTPGATVDEFMQQNGSILEVNVMNLDRATITVGRTSPSTTLHVPGASRPAMIYGVRSVSFIL